MRLARRENDTSFDRGYSTIGRRRYSGTRRLIEPVRLSHEDCYDLFGKDVFVKNIVSQGNNEQCSLFLGMLRICSLDWSLNWTAMTVSV